LIWLSIPPVANAGPDQVVAETDPVTLDGTLSDDSDGVVVAYSWTQIAGPNVDLSDDSIPSPSFTAPSGDGASLVTFSLTVVDNDGKLSLPDIVNIIIEDETSFEVPTTFEGGVVSGSETIGDVVEGSTYSLDILTSGGDSSFGELEQLVIPSGVEGDDVTFDFIGSPDRTFTSRHVIADGALYLDLNFDGVDYSTSSDFQLGIPPKVQFNVDCSFSTPDRFADGSPVLPMYVFDEDTADWELIGDPQKPNQYLLFRLIHL